MKYTKFVIIFLASFLIGFFVTTWAFGAGIDDNTLRLGDRNNSTDKEIQMGDGRLKWDGTSSKLSFSDDGGVGFKAIADIAANESSIIENTTVSTSVVTSALTINLKISDGATDPSAGGPAKTAFRDLTITDGAYNILSVTSALSIVIPSGATLGHLDGTDGFIYVYELDNAGTIELIVSSALKDESSVQTTQTISAASDDDDLYSTTGRSNVPIRLIARLKSNQTTAGTWDLDVVENTPGPHIFTDISDSLNKKVENSNNVVTRLESCQIDIVSGVPTIDDVAGLCTGWITSLTDLAVGQVQINLVNAPVANEGTCWCSSQDGPGTNLDCSIDGSNTSNVLVRTFPTASDTSSDVDFSIGCQFKD